MKLLLIPLMLALANGPATLVHAEGAWASIVRGNSCEALSRSVRIAVAGKPQAVAGFAFTPDHKRWGEFHARLSRMPRLGSSVMLEIGGQPFLLAARGADAWSRGPLQEQAIIAAAREASILRVQSRDRAGRRFSDSYLLDGAPAAIDSAAARCALRALAKTGENT